MSQLQHVGLLESLKYRMNQLVDSIGVLQLMIHNNSAPTMLPWPDILTRYNLLLSQIHGLYSALSYVQPQNQQQQQISQQQSSTRPLGNLVVHPTMLLTQQQLEHNLQQLFRTAQTPEVMKEEDSIVRRIAAMLKTSTPEGVPLNPGPEGCMRVVHECAEIKQEHDTRVQRAIRAVTLLRDKYDWHARVEANGAIDEDVERQVKELGEIEGEEGAYQLGPSAVENDHEDVAIDTTLLHDAPVDRNSEASTPSPSPSVHSETANEISLTEAVPSDPNSVAPDQ